MGALKPIRRLLIANRGEIAVRIARACREMEIESVAVYSDADADALHVRVADRAVRIGPAPAAESYLSVEAILSAARQTRADAVHPGYGFLSERAPLALGCEEAGLAFVGPPATVIERLGSKIESRRLMEAAGVPIVPGLTPADQTDNGVLSAAQSLGYPVLIKASAGGGGKGMRAAHDEIQARELIGAARREAAAAFGDGTLYLERLLDRPRHIEIQILADEHGHVVHLFERECSLQRRHQKVIEESPSSILTDAVRARMGEAAVTAARAAGYVNAGTLEFLLEGTDQEARFYFLEMNTRLQVEHPVTELVTGVDLVHAQLAVAAGERLAWTQSDFSQRGHAVECRIYAEDPSTGFLPQAGRVLLYREPRFPGVRVDSGITEGDVVGINYDPLLAKLVAYAPTRRQALARAAAALREFPILGLRTNIPFLLRLLEHPAVLAGEVHTAFIDVSLPALIPPPTIPAAVVAAAAATDGHGASEEHGATEKQSATEKHGRTLTRADPWSTLGRWGR
ncbi:MAG TPA: acetyl-CoA carboxylase biotin carboxylase subunit [Vicinamibacterales bacterium]|nr:acetyl-CoA carboxylase biotin carboxylase subunit [Vicinamibacterales bacterium]